MEGFDTVSHTRKLLVSEYPPENNLKIKQVKYLKSMHESGGEKNPWFCINPGLFVGAAYLEIIPMSQKGRESTKYGPSF